MDSELEAARHQGGFGQRRQVHRCGSEERLEFHVFGPWPYRPCQSGKCLGGSVGAFDTPSVSRVGVMLVRPPSGPSGSRPRNGRLMRRDVHPARGLGSPSLPEARQRGMVRQGRVQPVADEPADRLVHLSLAHQAPVLHDPKQEARRHRPNGELGIDPGPTVPGAVEARNLGSRPARIPHAIDPHKTIIVRDQSAQADRDEQLQPAPWRPSKRRFVHPAR